MNVKLHKMQDTCEFKNLNLQARLQIPETLYVLLFYSNEKIKINQNCKHNNGEFKKLTTT